MAAKKKTQDQVVLVAPLGELRAYTISEHELEKFERGGAVSDLLTIGLCLLSASLTVGATMWSTELPQPKVVFFFCALLIFALGGGVCTYLGWKLRTGTKELANRVRGRMPATPMIRVEPNIEEATGDPLIKLEAVTQAPPGNPAVPPEGLPAKGGM